MAVNYAISQLVLYSDLGVRKAIIDDYRSMQYKNVINDKGYFSLLINYNDSKRELFTLDSIIEVRRRIPGITDWYTDFIGHCEDFNTRFFSNGNYQYNVIGSSQNGLLARAIVAYKETTSGAKKSDASETVMKNYVKENVGSLSTIANSRMAENVISNFSVQATTGSGATWEGDRSGKNLLEVIQEIAKFSGIDFKVATDGTVGNYIFNTYVDQLGDDRTVVGLDTSTGLNAAGNAPHIFSPERGNVQEATLNEQHRKEANRIYAYGKGAGTSRNIKYRDNTTAQSESNLNLREAMRGAGSQDTDQQLYDFCDEWLEKSKAIEKFSFKPMDIPSSLYGVHYFFGDKVTVKLGDTEANKRIVGVSISLAGGKGESSKTIEFEDV